MDTYVARRCGTVGHEILADGEVASTLSELACRYVMKAIADDHLGLGKIEIPEKAPEPDENPSARE
jgi:hypothetical protein